MPARSSAATTRSKPATSGTGPMRTRYILRPAITSSRTNTLPRLPPRNFSAKRSAFAGSEKAPAWMNSGERVNGVPAALVWTGLPLDWVMAVPDAVAGCGIGGSGVAGDGWAKGTTVRAAADGAAAGGAAAAGVATAGPAPAGAAGAVEAVNTGGVIGSMVRTSTMAV